MYNSITLGDSDILPLSPDLPVFIVQDKDFFIGDDIAGSLKSRGPCRVVQITDPAEILPAVAREVHIDALFLEISHIEALEIGLDVALLLHDARVVLSAEVTEEAEVRARGWGLLRRPFNEAMIHEELADQGI